MSIVGALGQFLTDPANYVGHQGIPFRALQHLEYTGIALGLGAVIGAPVGLAIGHTGRFTLLAVNTGNAGRALPTLGLLTLLVLLIGFGLLPIVVALVVLTIPPLLTSAYAGVATADPLVVDAARGVGMRERQVLFRAELPLALPVMLGGLRSATLQVVSTATVAAYVSAGGLGRFLIDGIHRLDYGMVAGGAVLVGVLAILLDLALAGAQALIVSPGISGRVVRRRRRRTGQIPTPQTAEQT
jgi:osmoprotectant transport system permease protein